MHLLKSRWGKRFAQLVIGILLVLFAYANKDWGIVAGAIACVGLCSLLLIPFGMWEGTAVIEKGDPHAMHHPD